MCSLLQLFIDKGLKKSNACLNYKEWNDILNAKINADLLIQGSSKAWVQISPKHLDSTFSLNSYNLGIDGYNFAMQYTRFKLYLKYNRKPKYIIQIVDIFSLDKRKDLYMLEQFIPYLNIQEIKLATKDYEGFNFIDYYIPLKKYTHKRNLAVTGFLSNFNSGYNSSKYKGFETQDIPWDNSFQEFKLKQPHGIRMRIDENTKLLFNDFMQFCSNNSIKVALVYPPEYYEAQKYIINRDSIISTFKSISQKYNISFLDYSNDSLSMSTKFFYNSQHLNKLGVTIFNKKLSETLIKYNFVDSLNLFTQHQLNNYKNNKVCE